MQIMQMSLPWLIMSFGNMPSGNHVQYTPSLSSCSRFGLIHIHFFHFFELNELFLNNRTGMKYRQDSLIPQTVKISKVP